MAADSTRVREVPQVPPPLPAFNWVVVGGEARTRRDGLAMIVEGGTAAAIAVDTSVAPAAPVHVMQAQIWKVAGGEQAHVGLAFAVPTISGNPPACVIELAPDGNVRLARWNGRRLTGANAWSALSGLSSERATPDAATGALTIREIAAELSSDSLRVSVDGRIVPTVPLPVLCRSGFVGVYVDAGAAIRLAYLRVGG